MLFQWCHWVGKHKQKIQRVLIHFAQSISNIQRKFNRNTKEPVGQTWKKIWILLGAGNESQDPSASAWPTIKGIINLKLKTNLRPPNKFLQWSISPKRDTNCMISKLQFHCKIDLSSNWLKLRLYNLFCSQTPVPAQQLCKSKKELTLFSPRHKKKKKNPQQSLPERSALQTWNLEHKLNSQK